MDLNTSKMLLIFFPSLTPGADSTPLFKSIADGDTLSIAFNIFLRFKPPDNIIGVEVLISEIISQLKASPVPPISPFL